MNKSKYTVPYKCIKNLVCNRETKNSFTRGLVYNSYRTEDGNTCFINNLNFPHEITDDYFDKYFADVNYQLELL